MRSARLPLLYGIFLFLCVSLGHVVLPARVHAQNDETQQTRYFTGSVEEIIEEKKLSSEEHYTQVVRVRLSDTNEMVQVSAGTQQQPLSSSQRLSVGKKIIVAQQQSLEGQTEFVMADTYRLPVLWWLLGLLVVAVFLVGKWQGLGAFAGMLVSLAILVWYVVPHVLSGENPLIISLIGALGIGGVTLYLSHGVSIKTHISLVALYSVLVLVSLLTMASIFVGNILGLGSEEALFLQFGSTATINLQGLLMGGIILGALGVIDDIVVSQVAVVFQLKAAQKNSDFSELYTRGLFVGKEHVASLVNTLALAYAGANLPLFLLFMLNKTTPSWVIFNSETIAEEVVRTLVGSIGLVAAVPLTTLIAAFVAVQLPQKTLLKITDGHAHI